MRGIRKPEMIQEERDQEKEAMDKYIFATTFSVHQEPQRGGVLDSN